MPIAGLLNISLIRGWPENGVYIGRSNQRRGLLASKWANPFTVERYGREQAIDLYEHWLLTEREDLWPSLPELTGKTLICWCAPARCHGGVLGQIVHAYEWGEEQGGQGAAMLRAMRDADLTEAAR